MGAQLKSCQLSFSKSLFAGALKTGVNSRKKCLLLHGAEREGQGMFSRAAQPLWWLPAAAQKPVVYSWTSQFISARLPEQFFSDWQWGSCWKEHRANPVCQALASPTGPVTA